MRKNNSIKSVFKTEWFSIEKVKNKPLEKKPYYRLSCRDSVEILAVTKEKKIVLVRQFRPALRVYTLELPSGYIDENESRKEAVERELKEETGFTCNYVTCMGSFKIAPSRINNNLYIFFGKDATPKYIRRKAKLTKVILVTKEKFEKLINEGKFTEIAGVAIYYLAKFRKFM